MNPEHCSNPSCVNFDSPEHPKWYKRNGWYKTAAFGRVQTYLCLGCGKSFSDQTFSIDYFAKKVLNYNELESRLTSCSGIRSMARHFKVRDSTIENKIERYARWCQAIHSDIIRRLPMLEDIVVDGFESFSESQYYPNNINITAGKESQFHYGLGLSILSRKGKMTKKQKEKRDALERKAKPRKGDTQRSIFVLASEIEELCVLQYIFLKTIWSDKHPAYPNALKRAGGILLSTCEYFFRHITVSSKLARTIFNNLFAVNYLDREYRMMLSDHVRESTRFARHPSCMMSRMCIARFYHNCKKPYRLKYYKETSSKAILTHAEMAGLPAETLNQLISSRAGKRPFLTKTPLNVEERTSWLMGWKNPGYQSGKYIPKYIGI